MKKEKMRIMKDLERDFEEQRKKIQGEEKAEPEATPHQEDDDQEDWEEYEEVKTSIRKDGQNQSRKRCNHEKTVRSKDEGRTGKEKTR